MSRKCLKQYEFDYQGISLLRNYEYTICPDLIHRNALRVYPALPDEQKDINVFYSRLEETLWSFLKRRVRKIGANTVAVYINVFVMMTRINNPSKRKSLYVYYPHVKYFTRNSPSRAYKDYITLVGETLRTKSWSPHCDFNKWSTEIVYIRLHPCDCADCLKGIGIEE